MAVKILNNGKEIQYHKYVRIGEKYHRREGLHGNHPDQLYNYLKSNGVTEPEKYGIFHPIAVKYSNHTRDELVNRLVELEFELNKIEKL